MLDAKARKLTDDRKTIAGMAGDMIRKKRATLGFPG
jgi:hypothetical protein